MGISFSSDAANITERNLYLLYRRVTWHPLEGKAAFVRQFPE